MADFLLLPSDFSATTIEVVCQSDRAIERYYGARSVNVQKSLAPEWVRRIEADGFVVAIH